MPDGQHLASVRTVAKAPHKIVLANEGKELLIADAGDANVKVIDTKTFDVEKVIPLVHAPDDPGPDEEGQNETQAELPAPNGWQRLRQWFN